jgi:hypothetical protein
MATTCAATFLTEALEYLQLRGMLERHHRKSNLVRFKERREAAEEFPC